MVSGQNVKQVLQHRGQAALKQLLPIKSKRSSRKSHSFAKRQRVNKTGKSKRLSIKDIGKKLLVKTYLSNHVSTRFYRMQQV